MTELQKNYSILIVDDHQMIIDGLCSLLQSKPEYVVNGQANNGQEALDMIIAKPDFYQILLTDISMPLLTGIELCKLVKSQFPNIQVLILSMYNDASSIREAIMAEADGYILKNVGRQELLTALHRIADGGTFFSQEIVPIIYNQYHQEKTQDKALSILSAREIEILKLIVAEHTSEEIAQKLFISKKTVDNHRIHLLEKCNCRSTVGLVKYAIKTGLE